MLRPDNFVQDPFGTQGYNRYSYAWNNPLSYTDPNGEFIQYIIGAIVGGIVGTISGHKAGLRGWDLFGFAMANAAIGTISAGIGFVATSATSSALASTALSTAASAAVSGAAGGAAAGFVAGGMTATLNGGDFWKGALIGAGKGAAVGGAIGAISGGIQMRMEAAQAREEYWNSLIACEKCGRPDAIHSIGLIEITASKISKYGGIIGLGLDFNLAYPGWILGEKWGKGFAVGLFDDGTPSGKGLYFSSKDLINDGMAMSFSIDGSYARSNTRNFLPYKYLNGSGYEFMGGAGPIGISYGYPDNLFYNQYTVAYGIGIDLGYATWRTETTAVSFRDIKSILSLSRR